MRTKMTSINNSIFKNRLAALVGALILASSMQFAHAAESAQPQESEEPELPTLMTDSDEIPPSLLEYTHQQLPSGSLADSEMLKNQFSNLFTAPTYGAPLGAPLPDDSYIVSNAPMAFTREVKLCSDRDFISALTPNFGSGQTKAFDTIPHDDMITIETGCIMFAPSKDTRVVTPKGSVVIEKNSLAIVVCDASHLSVYDIHDDHKGSIRLETEGNTLSLSPGRHVTVTHGKVSEFSDINPIQTIMHKAVNTHKIGDQSKAFVSNFSILSAINSLQPLDALMKSKHSEARKVASQILKTSSILMQLDNNGSAYSFHTKQRSVALNGMTQ